MNILLDCDGVLADWLGHLLSKLAAAGHHYEREQIVTWDFLKSLDAEAKRYAYLQCGRPDFWATIPPMPGAQDGVNALREAGHDLTVVTAPWVSCDNWANTRRLWLKTHFRIKEADVIVTAKKKRVDGHYFFDDKPDTVWDWSFEQDGCGYVFDAPYNRNSKQPRVRNWRDLRALFEV